MYEYVIKGKIIREQKRIAKELGLVETDGDLGLMLEKDIAFRKGEKKIRFFSAV